MKIIEKELQTILGKDYEEIKEFYKNVITIQCLHKVFVTRRAYVLYKIFECVLGQNAHSYGSFYNTHSLPILKEIRNEKILIVDDIIVHGRTMDGIIRKMLNWGITKDQIVLWCIRCNTNACKLDELKKYLKHVIYVMPDEWEYYSDILTKSVINSNIGYISYVSSYQLHDTSISAIESALCRSSYEIIPNSDDYFSELGITSKIIWGNFFDDVVVNKYGITPCIRLYQRDKESNAVLAIPYVFLPSVYNEDVYKYCCSLLKDVGITSYPKLFDTNDKDILVLFYKWTTNAISKVVLDAFRDKCLTEYTFQMDYTNHFDCSESYPFAPDSFDQIPTDMALNGNYSSINSVPKSLSFCYNKVKSLFGNVSDTDTLSNAFSDYIEIMRTEDNKLALMNMERNPGIRLLDIIKSVPSKLCCTQFKRIIRSMIISAWDCGRCAYVIESIDIDINQNKGQNGIICCLVRHGEQAFREHYTRHKKVYNAFYSFFNRTNETRKEKLAEFAKHFDLQFNSTAFSAFMYGIDYDCYYDDLKNVIPDANYNETIIPNVKVDEVVTYYVDHYYKA